jgi:RNA polymerase sigma factor for flagellar operon FliA
MEGPAPESITESALWLRMREGDASARRQLLERHLPYCRVMAGVLYARRYDNQIEFGDYLQLASVGMLEAMERYDPARGVQFRTFAARRMQGAILNGLERLTEIGQQLAARRRLDRQERFEDVKVLADGEAGGAEAPTPADPLRLVSELGIGLALCWMLEGTGLVEDPEAATTLPFYRSAAIQQIRDRLRAAVETLPPAERAVIHGHYAEGTPFEELASAMSLSRGRISQIHRQALSRLRGLVRDHSDWSASF